MWPFLAGFSHLGYRFQAHRFCGRCCASFVLMAEHVDVLRDGFPSSVRDIWSCPLRAVSNSPAVWNIACEFLCVPVLSFHGCIIGEGAGSRDTENTGKQGRIFASETVLSTQGLWLAGYDKFWFFLILVSNRAEDADSRDETRHLVGFVVCRKMGEH